MTTYVALLRGINVGRHQQIAMADLRAICERLGYQGVRTHLRSGNVVFTAGPVDDGARADGLAREIEDAIRAEFGRTVACLIRTAGELRAVVDADPFAGVVTDPARYLVAFLAEPPAPGSLPATDAAMYAPDQFAVGRREVYLWLPGGIQDSKLAKTFLEKPATAVATTRNWNTVRKLAAIAEATPDPEPGPA